MTPIEKKTETMLGPGAFRFMLALAVFVHHLTRIAIGSAAVYVFFVLSGYWIYKMWTLKYSATKNPYPTYLGSRVWRLTPMFWLCGAVALCLQPWGKAGTTTEAHYWFSQVAILGYDSLAFKPNVPAWSLDIEMQFYLIAPILALTISKVKPSAAIGASAVMGGISLWIFPHSIACFLLFFVIGMTAAASSWEPSPRIRSVSLSLIAVCTATCLVFPQWRSIVLVGAHPGPLSWLNPAFQISAALLATPTAVHSTLRKGPKFWDKTLADASYSLYLLHWPLFQWLQHHPSGVPRPIATAALFLVTIALSFAGTLVVDHPIQSLRLKWLSHRKASKDGAQPAAGEGKPSRPVLP